MINTALIAAAGFGTRFLPITKTIQKEMLPFMNRPIIDYVVNDCIKAGIEEIVIITREGEDQIKNYFTENNTLYKYLKLQNKLDKYEQISHLHTQANFHFIDQKLSDGYGTGIPVKLAAEKLKDTEAFLVFIKTKC